MPRYSPKPNAPHAAQVAVPRHEPACCPRPPIASWQTALCFCMHPCDGELMPLNSPPTPLPLILSGCNDIAPRMLRCSSDKRRNRTLAPQSMCPPALWASLAQTVERLHRYTCAQAVVAASSHA